jgi:hypothetical protein
MTTWFLDKLGFYKIHKSKTCCFEKSCKIQQISYAATTNYLWLTLIITNYLWFSLITFVKGCKYNWVDPLGTTSRNSIGTKIGQIIFFAHFFKCFHNYNVFMKIMFIYCMPKYMAWSFHYNKKRWKFLQICIPCWWSPFRNQVPKLLKFIAKFYLFK